MDQKQQWEKAVAFHGHSCGGLAIGFQAARYAAELLGLTFSGDEEVVCIAENDACGVDAIQVLLGCTVGKGNLMFHMRGKQAFSFYDRKTGRSVRLSLRGAPRDIPPGDRERYFLDSSGEALFDVKETTIPLPEEARLFEACRCECCGEETGTNWIRISGGKKVCLDCCPRYDRFDV